MLSAEIQVGTKFFQLLFNLRAEIPRLHLENNF